MGDQEEAQKEEIEVLESIYDGDECFKSINETTYQYKIGEDGASKSFLLEIIWGPQYPEECPQVNLELFYNKHLLSAVKDSIIEKIQEEAEQWIGNAMTYTLFEYAKENTDELLKDQPETIVINSHMEEPKEVVIQEKALKVKKEQLTKAQKRKIVNRLNNKGELPRGHDWIDVIKHLCQTGPSQNS